MGEPLRRISDARLRAHIERLKSRTLAQEVREQALALGSLAPLVSDAAKASETFDEDELELLETENEKA